MGDIDSLLALEIIHLRNEARLPEIFINVILTECSRHHTDYMTKSGMVSHYQDMKFRKMRRLYSPKDRLAYFSNKLGIKESYSEICLAVPVNAYSSKKGIAKGIVRTILDSSNREALLHPAARHFGVSVKQRKSMAYATINIGLGYHNIVALIE